MIGDHATCGWTSSSAADNLFEHVPNMPVNMVTALEANARATAVTNLPLRAIMPEVLASSALLAAGDAKQALPAIEAVDEMLCKHVEQLNERLLLELLQRQRMAAFPLPAAPATSSPGFQMPPPQPETGMAYAKHHVLARPRDSSTGWSTPEPEQVLESPIPGVGQDTVMRQRPVPKGRFLPCKTGFESKDQKEPVARTPGLQPAFVDAAQEHSPMDQSSAASVGSIGHPYSCGQACKYISKSRGCKDGRFCVRCHLCKWRAPLNPKRQNYGSRRS
eukprot:TRINITY_DN25678_c0_g1_i1.p1 TRINITY_DN25678_c0_g1~~TRINITY_DN25678_c0_g1_i1.p1  ORF type:complete len:276 (-),score=41.89 TRINITY_DN25678_c0_g1_i1:44-871(-)